MFSTRTMWMRILVVMVALIGLLFLSRSMAQDAPDPGKAAPKIQPRPAPDSSADQPPKERPSGEESLFELLLKGGWVMVPLALCSILAVAFIIERFIGLRRTKIIPEGFVGGLKEAFGPSADAEAGVKYCQEHPSTVSVIFRAGMSRMSLGHVAMEKAIEDAGQRETYKLKRSLRPLSLIAAISPLLGLLGTVYGLITAFQSAWGMGVGRGDALAKGIYEALVTTATGLTLAIPVLVIYQVLCSKVDGFVDDIDEDAIELLDHALAHGPSGKDKKGK